MPLSDFLPILLTIFHQTTFALKHDKTKFLTLHWKSTRFVAEALFTVHAQKLPCIQWACPIELMSHVKGPFVLDFRTPNSLVRPINFDFKYFRAKICHFNLLRNHHSFLRQDVNNTWQFKKELFATVTAPAKPLDSQTNDQSILNALRLYF